MAFVVNGMQNGREGKGRKTYAALAERTGVGRRRKVETPRVVGDRILPVDETFGSLSDARSYNETKCHYMVEKIGFFKVETRTTLFFYPIYNGHFPNFSGKETNDIPRRDYKYKRELLKSEIDKSR